MPTGNSAHAAQSQFATSSVPPVLLSAPLVEEVVKLLMRRPDAAEVNLSPSDARTVASYMHFEQVPTSSLIRFRTDRNLRMMLLLDGEVSVYLVDSNEKLARPLSHLGAGAIFGQLSAFTRTAMPTVAHVERDLSCGSLTAAGLNRISERYPSVANKFLRLLLTETAMVAAESIRQINALNRVNESLRGQINSDRAEERFMAQFKLD
jgi:CRP-like cAMP-binding protein